MSGIKDQGSSGINLDSRRKTEPASKTAPQPTTPGKETRTAGALPRTTGERSPGATDPVARPAPADVILPGQSPRRAPTPAVPTGSAQRYDDMLATLLAAQQLTEHAAPDDAAARTQIIEMLGPVEKRLNELNDHQGRFAQFGAGNIAGQAELDMSETAVRSWRQRLALGTMIRTDELVMRFRAGAEAIKFLTRENADAPTLRAFDHASSLVGVGAAVPVLAPALVALAVEEAALLVFVGRVTARRIALWALSHPAAALAASEALLGLGVQIGEDGWEPFWNQLQDPQGRWFLIAQVLMDYMHVRTSMSPHGDAPQAPSAPRGAQPPDLEGAHQQAGKARAVLRQVHDAAASEPERSTRPTDGAPPLGKGAVPSHDQAARVDRTSTTDALVDSAGPELGKVNAATLLLEEIERHAGGLRRPALETIEPTEMDRLRTEFADLGGDPDMLRFNHGRQTAYKDDTNVIQVRGDVNPVEDSMHPRSAMSSKAALGHELGHAAHRGTKLAAGAWNDEFRASYWAAKNLGSLSDQDRIHLILDAMERAKEAGVAIRANALMKRILYGY